jgi:hypothetical protein
MTAATPARLAKLHPHPVDPMAFAMALRVLVKVDRLSEVDASFVRACAAVALDARVIPEMRARLGDIARRVVAEGPR